MAVSKGTARREEAKDRCKVICFAPACPPKHLSGQARAAGLHAPGLLSGGRKEGCRSWKALLAAGVTAVGGDFLAFGEGLSSTPGLAALVGSGKEQKFCRNRTLAVLAPSCLCVSAACLYAAFATSNSSFRKTELLHLV